MNPTTNDIDIDNMDWLQEFDDFDNVFKIQGLLVENDKPDYETVTIDDQNIDSDLKRVINTHFGEDADYAEVIFKNTCNANSGDVLCPFIRVLLYGIGSKVAINHKLEHVLKQCNATWVPVRCEKALIFGLFSRTEINRFSNIPFEFQSYIMSRDTDKSDQGFNLSGNLVFIPYELQLKIIQFVSHPCADIIRQYWRDIDSRWDFHFLDVFSSISQRSFKIYKW